MRKLLLVFSFLLIASCASATPRDTWAQGSAYSAYVADPKLAGLYDKVTYTPNVAGTGLDIRTDGKKYCPDAHGVMKETAGQTTNGHVEFKAN